MPVASRRTAAPRMNSCPMVPTTKAHSAKHTPDTHTRNPSAYSPAPVATASTTGHVNW